MGRGRAGSGVTPKGERIQLTFQWRGARWRPTLPMRPTPANLKYAARTLAEIREKVRHGTFRFADYFPDARNAPAEGGAKLQTFEQYAKRWMEAQGHLAASTRKAYQSSLDTHLLPRFGIEPIDAILHSELAAFFGTGWSSAKTRNNALIPARGVFSMAMRDGAVERDPTAGVENQSHQAAEADPMTQEEAVSVVAWIRKRWPAEADYFEFAFWTGMRTSELVELRWTDVDLPSSTVRVTRARVRGDLKDTKTHVARTVELNSRARAALDRQRPISQLSGGYVFLNSTTGQAFADDQIPRRRWTAALKGLTLRHRDAYQTRHSYATWCLMAGANPAWLATQLGHSTEVLFRTYGKWIASADRGRELAKVEASMEKTG